MDKVHGLNCPTRTVGSFRKSRILQESRQELLKRDQNLEDITEAWPQTEDFCGWY